MLRIRHEVTPHVSSATTSVLLSFCTSVNCENNQKKLIKPRMSYGSTNLCIAITDATTKILEKYEIALRAESLRSNAPTLLDLWNSVKHITMWNFIKTQSMHVKTLKQLPSKKFEVKCHQNLIICIVHHNTCSVLKTTLHHFLINSFSSVFAYRQLTHWQINRHD